MWSSEQESNTTNPNPNYRTLGSSSSSSSRSSLSSITSIILPQTPRRSMEDVWKDISLMTPLQNHHHHHHQNNQKPNPNSFKGMILQDFLAGPLNRPVKAALPPIPPQNQPETVLSLNSLEFSYLANGPSSNNSSSGDSRVNGRVTETSSYMSSAFPELIAGPSSPGNILSFCSKSRVPEVRTGTGTGDRRQKRMIKNRESAARSRARKQAYTNELELEVAHLVEENSKLKMQQEELRVAMAAQLPTRSGLQRCSSSPF